MPVRKIRVEVFDGNGNRYTVTFQGRVTREKALRLLDTVELLGGMPGAVSEFEGRNPERSKFDKVRYLIQEDFPVIWFSSRDVQSLYEQKLKESISLSTVSTYLSRMVTRGLLVKRELSNNLRYRITTELPRARSSLSMVKGNK